jgi:gluconate kinase
MAAGMLASQLATLEEPLPDEGITFGIKAGIGELVDQIRQAFGLAPAVGDRRTIPPSDR